MTDANSDSRGPDFILNPRLDRNAPYGDDLRNILSRDKGRSAHAAIAAWDGYAPTPLRDLPAIADALDLGQVLYKDEGGRFGLRSFKALGGAYAVDRLVGARGREGLTVACDAGGKPGRSVAWVARPGHSLPWADPGPPGPQFPRPPPAPRGRGPGQWLADRLRHLLARL